MLDFSYYNVGLNFVKDRVVACHLTTCVGLGLFGWEKIVDLLYVRTDESSSVMQGKVLLAGGEVGSETTELVDVEKGISQESFPLIPGRFDHCAIQLSESEVVMTGGIDRSGPGSPLATLVTQFSMDEAGQATSTELPRLTQARFDHACGAYMVAGTQVSLSKSY